MILAIADACEHSTDNDGYNDARDCGFANSPPPLIVAAWTSPSGQCTLDYARTCRAQPGSAGAHPMATTVSNRPSA